jgi:ribA/ribD-fused uncharacterized protein
MKTARGMTMFFGRDDIPSNWFIGAPFVLKNVRFNIPNGPVKVIDEVRCHCGEMAMMVLKAALFGDLDVFHELLLTYEPRDIKALGRKVKPWDENVWLRHRKDIMLTVVLARARQDAAMRDWLLSTGDTEIVEASQYDRIWGAGLSQDDERIYDHRNWNGALNLLGETYMTARRILREELEFLLSVNRAVLPGIVKVGMNDSAKVKLTQYGSTVYRQHLGRLTFQPRHSDGREIVEGGLYDFKLWDLMHIFGSVDFVGEPGVCFESNVVLVTPQAL